MASDNAGTDPSLVERQFLVMGEGETAAVVELVTATMAETITLVVARASWILGAACVAESVAVAWSAVASWSHQAA